MSKKSTFFSYAVFHKLTPLMMRGEFFYFLKFKSIINNSIVENACDLRVFCGHKK